MHRLLVHLEVVLLAECRTAEAADWAELLVHRCVVLLGVRALLERLAACGAWERAHLAVHHGDVACEAVLEGEARGAFVACVLTCRTVAGLDVLVEVAALAEHGVALRAGVRTLTCVRGALMCAQCAGVGEARVACRALVRGAGGALVGVEQEVDRHASVLFHGERVVGGGSKCGPEAVGRCGIGAGGRQVLCSWEADGRTRTRERACISGGAHRASES